MRLNQNFIRYNMDGMTMIVPVAGADFRGVVQGNATLNVILEYMEQDMSEEDIIRAMCDRFDGDPDEIRSDVTNVVARLREIGAIDG